MYYRVGKKLEPLGVPLPDGGAHPLLALMSPEELRREGPGLGFAERTIQECGNIRLSKIESLYGYLFGTLRIPLKNKNAWKHEALAFYIKKGLLVILDEKGIIQKRLAALATFKNWDRASFEQMIYDILNDLIRDDLSVLEGLESRITLLEENVLNDALADFNRKLTLLRRELLYLHSYYEELVGIGAELQENEAAVFEPKRLKLFKLFIERAARLSSNAQTLREYSMQVREVYQAQVDIQQNRVMKVLAVVTTLFSPLALIVGWYGMNFTGMPELRWPMGYPMVIMLSIVVVVACLIFFRRKKFF